MANSSNNNSNNTNQESTLRFLAIIMGQLMGGNQLNPFFTCFPPAGRLTLSRGIWRLHQQKTWENTTPSQRCESFTLVLGRVLVLPPQASAKAVNLTDDSSWQNSAHPRKRSTSGKQRGQYDAGIWLSTASHSPENPSFGGLQTARAAHGTAFHQTLSWMNRESCV